MSIQYMVPGFKLTTLEHEVPPITTRPELPPSIWSLNYMKRSIDLFAPTATVIYIGLKLGRYQTTCARTI